MIFSQEDEKNNQQHAFTLEVLKANRHLKKEIKQLNEHIALLKDAISHLNQVKSDMERGQVF